MLSSMDVTVRVFLNNIVLPLLRVDSLGGLIEPEELILSTLLPSVEMNPSTTVALHDSLHWHS